MRLIDADALKETLKDLCSASNNVMQRQIENSILHGIMPQIIDDEPTVDAEPTVDDESIKAWKQWGIDG